MNKQNCYQALVDDYNELMQFGKKLGLVGGTIQLSLMLFLNAWKHIEIPHYKVGAPLLFLWCLYQLAKDFFTFLKVDSYGSQLILKGISLENKNTSLGKHFHEVLENFNFIKILLQRSLVNFLAFGCFGYFLSQFISDFMPDFVVRYGWLAVISACLTGVVNILYYASLKPMEELKLLEAKAIKR